MLKDQRDLLLAFNTHSVRYLLIGGHALGRYTEPRVTGDMDIFTEISEKNSERVFAALAEYGAPLSGYSPETFRNPYEGFQIGSPPTTDRADLCDQRPYLRAGLDNQHPRLYRR